MHTQKKNTDKNMSPYLVKILLYNKLGRVVDKYGMSSEA